MLNNSRYVVRRILLSENSPVTLPVGHQRLASDIVISDDTDEPLVELWVLVPEVNSLATSQPTKGPQSIYTRTEVYEEDDDGGFTELDIEKSVSRNLENFNKDTYDEWQ